MSRSNLSTLPYSSPIEHKANGKCMCEACNCGTSKIYLGRHKCPDPIQKGEYNSSYTADYPKYDGFKPEGKYKMIHRNFILPDDKFKGQSSYTDEYNQKGLSRPAEKIVPKNELGLSSDPFQANSSYIEDYLNRGQGVRAEKVQLPKNYVMPEGKFAGDTSYHGDYLGGPTEKQKQFRPVGELKTGGDFQGVSSYVADYENKGKGIKAERVPLPRNQVIPEGRFEGSSNYTSNFQPGRIERSEQYKPEGELKIGGNFEGASSYGADYSPKGKIQRAERYPLPQNQVMPDGKFQGNSSYNENYIQNKLERREQFKPEGEMKIGGDFKGESSYLTDYSNKGVGIKAERVPLTKNHVMPEGKFSGNSAYNSDFIESRIEKNEQIRPVGQLKVGEGSFNGVSSYNNDYLNQGKGIRAERAPLPNNQVIPQGKFEANSTYGQTYTGVGDLRKENCPCDELHAPRHQVASREHIRYNEKSHRWE